MSGIGFSRGRYFMKLMKFMLLRFFLLVLVYFKFLGGIVVLGLYGIWFYKILRVRVFYVIFFKKDF